MFAVWLCAAPIGDDDDDGLPPTALLNKSSRAEAGQLRLSPTNFLSLPIKSIHPICRSASILKNTTSIPHGKRREWDLPGGAAGGAAVRHRRHDVRLRPVPPPRLLGAPPEPGLQRRGAHHARVRDGAHGRPQQRADRPLPVPGLAAGPARRLLRREGGPLRAVRRRGAPGGARAGGAVPVGAGARAQAGGSHQRAPRQRRAHDRDPRPGRLLPARRRRRGLRRGTLQAMPRPLPPRARPARRVGGAVSGVRGLRRRRAGRRGRGDAGRGCREREPGGQGRRRRRVHGRQGLPRRQALGRAGRCRRRRRRAQD